MEIFQLLNKRYFLKWLKATLHLVSNVCGFNETKTIWGYLTVQIRSTFVWPGSSKYLVHFWVPHNEDFNVASYRLGNASEPCHNVTSTLPSWRVEDSDSFSTRDLFALFRGLPFNVTRFASSNWLLRVQAWTMQLSGTVIDGWMFPTLRSRPLRDHSCVTMEIATRASSRTWGLSPCILDGPGNGVDVHLLSKTSLIV